MITPIPLDQLEQGGSNAPRVVVDDVNDFWPIRGEGAAQYRYEYKEGVYLDSLLINKNASTLVVTFHGALNRETTELPRYERLKTKSEMDINSMYFSDPSLYLDEDIQLAWFTGWGDVPVLDHCARWITKTAVALNVTRIIISGSSGGGFAALQVAARIPGSIALPFNPQTSISNYAIENDPDKYGPARKYVEVCHPELAPGGLQTISLGGDWDLLGGNDLAPVRTYEHSTDNFIMYCHSPNDWLHDTHYVPFLVAAAKGDNLQRMRIFEYQDKVGHYPPQLPLFKEALEEAIAWKLPRK